MSVSADISTLGSQNAVPYTARASLNADGSINSSTSTVTGDRTSGLFKNASKEMGKDDFLQLLVTQMRYQDPMNPMDNTQFLSELAQFRALEGSDNVEKAINQLNDSFKGTVDAQKYSAMSLTNTSAVSLIGKSVRMRQTDVQWYAKAGDKVNLQVHLGDSDSATVEIRDKDGTVVRSLQTSGKDKENSAAAVWDGKNDKGEVAPAGKYQIYIQGEDKDPSLYAFVQDTVAGVRFTTDGALVKIGGRELSIGNVLDVSEGSSSNGLGISSSNAISLLGRDVRVAQDSVSFHQRSMEQEVFYVNANPYSKVAVELKDSDGNVVKTMMSTADANGKAEFVWNGETNSGGYADIGTYQINIPGASTNSSLYSYMEGTVQGVTNLGGDTRLRINGALVSLSDVIDISAIPKDGTATAQGEAV